MTMDQYRPLEISPPEFAAMIGIQLWNCGDFIDFLDSLNLVRYHLGLNAINKSYRIQDQIAAGPENQ